MDFVGTPERVHTLDGSFVDPEVSTVASMTPTTVYILTNRNSEL